MIGQLIGGHMAAREAARQAEENAHHARLAYRQAVREWVWRQPSVPRRSFIPSIPLATNERPAADCRTEENQLSH